MDFLPLSVTVSNSCFTNCNFTVEGCFLVSSLEFCPAHRRGQGRFALWAHCASVFVCACLCCCLLVFTHSPGINKAHGECCI